MSAVARQDFAATEIHVTVGADGVERISPTLRDHFAPEAVDPVYQEVARFVQLKRADQVEIDLL